MQLQELKNEHICRFTKVSQGKKKVKITMKKAINNDKHTKATPEGGQELKGLKGSAKSPKKRLFGLRYG